MVAGNPRFYENSSFLNESPTILNRPVFKTILFKKYVSRHVFFMRIWIASLESVFFELLEGGGLRLTCFALALAHLCYISA